MSLVVEQLCKEYPTRAGSLSVLRGIDLTLQPGEAIAITGPSGSGKSTLLHILGTLERPTSGTVRLDGTDPFSLSEEQLAAHRNTKVGFVFQDHYLLPQCSVLENVLIPSVVNASADQDALTQRATDLLQRVGLGERIDHRPAELSGGERQRAAVARALIHKPPLLLADEPTGNLDRKTARTVGELLVELHRQENNILIVVTHSPELASLFPQRFEMNDGTLHPV